MRRLFFCLTLLLLTSCATDYPMLYMGKSADYTPYNASDIKTEWGSVLSPTLQTKAIRYLSRKTSWTIPLVGGPGNVNSFREYSDKMNAPFPDAMSVYRLTAREIVEGMDYKDIWLSKGPPLAVFVADGFITWRFKDNNLAVFVEGKTVSISR